MQIKDRTNTKFLGLASLALAGMVFSSTMVLAGVSGVCSLCHTMHNSQDGTNEVVIGAGSGWSGDGGTLGGVLPSATAQAKLLKTDCVGCHSSTSADTIITISGNDIPIVLNTVAPTTPLAGGNFFWVNTVADDRGHNVMGAAPGVDGALALAPANTGCANSCHTTLFLPQTSAAADFDGIGEEFNPGGCRGCHTALGHHSTTDATYRYLSGHGSAGIVDGGGVAQPNPYEDDDWEFTKGPADHNFYKWQTPNAYNEISPMSMGRFCAGCHGAFHAMGITPFDLSLGGVNGGDPNTDDTAGNNPWLRHPTNVMIPNDGEYASMFGGGAPYNPDVPVARNPAVGNAATIQANDQVMCLSCHRAHGSDQPDMLRFDYTTVLAHNGDSTAGCFYCHTTKDNL